MINICLLMKNSSSSFKKVSYETNDNEIFIVGFIN